jgi:hypothetical protein
MGSFPREIEFENPKKRQMPLAVLAGASTERDCQATITAKVAFPHAQNSRIDRKLAPKKHRLTPKTGPNDILARLGKGSLRRGTNRSRVPATCPPPFRLRGFASPLPRGVSLRAQRPRVPDWLVYLGRVILPRRSWSHGYCCPQRRHLIGDLGVDSAQLANQLALFDELPNNWVILDEKHSSSEWCGNTAKI